MIYQQLIARYQHRRIPYDELLNTVEWAEKRQRIPETGFPAEAA